MVAYLERPTDSDDFTKIVDFLNANPIRIGKDFLGKVTPLFDTMLIQHQSEVGDSLDRVATIASSLEAEQISGSGYRRQDTKGDTIAQTRFENVSKTSYDSPLGGVYTPQSDEDSMKLKELMEMCTNLLQRVQDLETTKTAQAKEITSLKKRVKKLKHRGRSRTPRLKRLYKGRNIAEIDTDVDISLDMADQEVNVAKKEVSVADPVTTAGEVVTTASVDISTASVPITVSTATPTTPPTTTTEDDMTLAETLMEIKSAKPKAIGVVMQEPSEIPRISAAQQQIQEKAQGSRDKGKAKMVEEEEPKEPTKIKDQIKHDEELAQRLDAQLQAEMEKEDRLARQREEEDNIVSWDNAQAMMEADYQMAERLHAEEQASLTDEEKASLFVQLLDARKKHFAALRAQEIRNKPPTKMQKRTTMCNYLKNMAGYKHNQLRHKSFDDIQKLFDKALKRVNTFVPMDTEKVEGSKAKAAGSETRVEESSKRAGEELDRESTKKQKVEDETEQAELKECFEIIPFDEDAVNTIPLATKQAPIVDYKITRDARKIYYHITRADGSTKVYMRFEDMLKMFDREDLEVLYKIVKDKFKSTKPREQGRYLIKSWKLIDLCRVHCLMLESMYIYMLVEKEYPLAQFTYRRMWEGKLQVDYVCEMAFELLSWVRVTKDIRIASNPFLRPYPHTILYHITDFDLAVNISQSFNCEDFLKTSQISTSEEIDYDSPEPPKSLLKWYHYLSDEYKDNGRLANAKTWDAIKGKTFRVQIPPTMTFAEVKIGKRNLRSGKVRNEIIEISSDSSEDRKGASKATAPIFYGPSTQGLLDAYGYNTIEEYLSWNYFPSTDNESTDMETTDKRNTDKDCIVDSNSAMSKEIEKDNGSQEINLCNKAKGENKGSVEAVILALGSELAHCICSCIMHIAFVTFAIAACIATKHLHIVIADSIMHIAFVALH
ncbi:hypothetical protein Tco_0133928 [Tanacetum coccineum]